MTELFSARRVSLLACYAVSDVRPNSLRTRWPWCSGAGVKGLSDTLIKAGVAFTKRLGDRVKFVTRAVYSSPFRRPWYQRDDVELGGSASPSARQAR
jgi:hypothetical protein